MAGSKAELESVIVLSGRRKMGENLSGSLIFMQTWWIKVYQIPEQLWFLMNGALWWGSYLLIQA